LNNARGEYGSAYAPITLGSGGGDDGEASTPGTGGGAFKLYLNGSGTMTFGNGATLTADGGNASAADSGGGAGGSIWIDAPSGTVVAPAVARSTSARSAAGRAQARRRRRRRRPHRDVRRYLHELRQLRF